MTAMTGYAAAYIAIVCQNSAFLCDYEALCASIAPRGNDGEGGRGGLRGAIAVSFERMTNQISLISFKFSRAISFEGTRLAPAVVVAGDCRSRSLRARGLKRSPRRCYSGGLPRGAKSRKREKAFARACYRVTGGVGTLAA